MNLDTDLIPLVLQVRADLPVEIKHIVQRDEELSLEIFLVLAQPNCCRHDGSIKPSIFGGVRTMPTLHKIRLKVVKYEFF